MHLISEEAGIVDELDFALLLEKPHAYHGIDKLCRRLCVLAEEVTQDKGVVVPCRREKMHFAAGCQGGGDCLRECGCRSGCVSAGVCGPGGYGRLRAHPDDVVDCEIVRIYGCLCFVKVDYGTVERLVDSEIIDPGAFLTPFVAVVPILCGSFRIANEKRYSTAALRGGLRHFFYESGASSRVDFF